MAGNGHGIKNNYGAAKQHCQFKIAGKTGRQKRKYQKGKQGQRQAPQNSCAQQLFPFRFGFRAACFEFMKKMSIERKIGKNIEKSQISKGQGKMTYA